MSVSNGLISDTNVSIEDVRTVLSKSSRDLGTLCQSDNINQWAKYKPIRYNKIGKLTESELENSAYGLKGNGNTLSTLLTASDIYVSNGKNVITTHKFISLPRGNAYNEPYRLTDFCGYYHNAPAGVSVDKIDANTVSWFYIDEAWRTGTTLPTNFIANNYVNKITLILDSTILSNSNTDKFLTIQDVVDNIGFAANYNYHIAILLLDQDNFGLNKYIIFDTGVPLSIMTSANASASRFYYYNNDSSNYDNVVAYYL